MTTNQYPQRCACGVLCPPGSGRLRAIYPPPPERRTTAQWLRRRKRPKPVGWEVNCPDCQVTPFEGHQARANLFGDMNEALELARLAARLVETTR